MPEEKPELRDKNEIVEFADQKETDFSSVLVWIAFVVALLFMGFIWFSNNSLKKEISDKQNQKSEADATLALPENLKVVSDVTGVKNVISVLSGVSTTEKSKKLVFDDLYKNFTKDVHISTISLSQDGTVGIDGTTASYRTAADFMMGLKSYSKVSGLELNTISLSTDPAVGPTEKVSFSVAFKLDMTKDPEVTASSTNTQSTSAPDSSVSSDSTSTTAPPVDSTIDSSQNLSPEVTP